jgi:hypothetical protein
VGGAKGRRGPSRPHAVVPGSGVIPEHWRSREVVYRNASTRPPTTHTTPSTSSRVPRLRRRVVVGEGHCRRRPSPPCHRPAVVREEGEGGQRHDPHRQPQFRSRSPRSQPSAALASFRNTGAAERRLVGRRLELVIGPLLPAVCCWLGATLHSVMLRTELLVLSARLLIQLRVVVTFDLSPAPSKPHLQSIRLSRAPQASFQNTGAADRRRVGEALGAIPGGAFMLDAEAPLTPKTMRRDERRHASYRGHRPGTKRSEDNRPHRQDWRHELKVTPPDRRPTRTTCPFAYRVP